MAPKWLRVAGFWVALAGCAAAESRVEEWAVVLDAAPVAARVAPRAGLATPAARAAGMAVERAQNAVRSDLARRGVRVTGAARTLVNAIFVRATPEQARQLRNLPGVARVEYLPPVRMLMDRAATLVRAAAAWEAVGGQQNAGLGVRIGIIDSGIDEQHPAFQDSSLPAPENPPESPAENAPYTNSKVLVARSYVDKLPNQPDDTSPRDHVGHGTAIAMAAAGLPVRGPAAEISGIAPKAYLGNYKIFGSPGVNDTSLGSVVIQALEDAVNDRMDIVVLAVGQQPQYPPSAQDPSCGPSSLGLGVPSDACDAIAQAAEAAVQRGVTVVAAAGDDAGLSAQRWPTLATINSPGTAPSVITVGASENAYSSVSVGGDEVPAELGKIRALFGDGPRPAEPLTATAKDVAELDTTGLACVELPGDSLAGAIAVIVRGECDFATKVSHAKSAGAAAVILYNSPGNDWAFNPVGLAEIALPTVMVANNAGVALAGHIRSVPSSPVTIDPSYPGPGEVPEEVTVSSSRGPGLGSDPGQPQTPSPTIKPELIAPGAGLYTATQSLDSNGWYWDPSGYTYVEGSSFSAGIVAGAAALVKQQNPGFDPPKIRSAVINTAVAEVTELGNPASVIAAGAGKLNVAAAAGTTAVLEPATVSFGLIQEATLPVSLALKVTNTGKQAASYQVGVNRTSPDDNAQLNISPSSLELNAGDSGTVTVQLEGSRPNPGSYEGYITLQGEGVNLRAPYLYIVSDGQPADIFPIVNGSFTGKANDSDWLIAFRLVDRFGIPLAHVPVEFRAGAGGGKIACSNPNGCADAETDVSGKAGALVTLGPDSQQTFTAEAAGLTVEFFATVQ